MAEQRRYTRSVSQLKTYSRCGEAFRLQRMVRPRLQERPASWFAGGTAFQLAADDWERSGRTTDIQADFIRHYLEAIEELKERQPDLRLWQKPPQTKSVERDIELRMKAGLEKWIPNYLQYAEAEDWEIWLDPFGDPALEVEFTYEIGGVVINGGIDRMLWWPRLEVVTIEDLKTGNREDDIRQLGLYGYVANQIFADDLPRPIDSVRYWYAKDGEAGPWEGISRFTDEYLSSEYGALDRGIQNRVFVANPGKNCEMCGVQPWCRLKGYLQEGEPLREDN